VLLVGIAQQDEIEDMVWMSQKILNLRIFANEANKMNLSVQDIQGQILCIRQFTLLADTKRGNRPSFIGAAKPEKANLLFQQFEQLLKKTNLKVASGIFGADMQVRLTNDGPVTIVIDSHQK
jgi:D-aminoacyl-tRNA deacylase